MTPKPKDDLWNREYCCDEGGIDITQYIEKQKVKDFLDWCNKKSILNFKWSKIEDLYEFEQKKKELLK